MAEWNLFLKGVLIDGDIKSIKNPDPALLSEKQWRFILNLECINPNFEGLPQNIVSEFKAWKEWFTCKEPQY